MFLPVLHFLSRRDRCDVCMQCAQDYNLRNTFESLADASIQVSAVFSELHDSYGYHGDHTSDQTADKQHLAG